MIYIAKKAAKIATDARVTLRWLDLQQRRFYHRTFTKQDVNGFMDHYMKLLTNGSVHNNHTRNGDKLRLPRVTRNWGKELAKDWNKLNKDIRNSFCTEF